MAARDGSGIGDAVEKARQKFLMWFEPERVAGGTYIAKAHPEWVIGGAGGGLFNLGIPEARQYMTDFLNAAIQEYKLTGLRIDDCASGGRHIDLEAVSREFVLWRSDNTCDMLDRKPNEVQGRKAAVGRPVPLPG